MEGLWRRCMSLMMRWGHLKPKRMHKYCEELKSHGRRCRRSVPFIRHGFVLCATRFNAPPTLVEPGCRHAWLDNNAAHSRAELPTPPPNYRKL